MSELRPEHWTAIIVAALSLVGVLGGGMLAALAGWLKARADRQLVLGILAGTIFTRWYDRSRPARRIVNWLWTMDQRAPGRWWTRCRDFTTRASTRRASAR